jgi:transcription elongation factor/antiterminator RfaH
MVLKQDWYVVYTKSKFENVVFDGFSKKNLEAFLPKMSVLSKRRDRRKMLNSPIFPGYVFVKSNMNANEHIEILKTVGVVNLIKNHKGPVCVDEESINSLKIMVSEKSENLLTGSSFSKGAKVRVIYGPFKGVTGTFINMKGRERVIVNFETLGQFVSVDVSQDDVEVID